MSLFYRFYPQHYIDSAYDIPYAELYSQGFRGIVFDIDNTLVEHGAPANERAIALFAKLHGLGFRTVALSNNNEGRVKPFADQVGCGYIHKAGKPRPQSYCKAMEMMGSDKATTFFVGDQLFTDIWGANNAGIPSWLVAQIDKKEELQIVVKRFFEKPVLYFYHKKQAGKMSFTVKTVTIKEDKLI
jgi:HAD superfamily phosphatase (TIGR01668 family)